MVRVVLAGFVATVLVLLLWPSEVAAQLSSALRIMPMGDSITIGESADVPASHWVGYRFPLYQRLTAAGLRFDLVGSLQVGDARLPDRDVEARGGRTIAEISAWARERVAARQPNVVMLMAGTNDAAQELSSGAGPRYRILLQQIRAGRPDAEVLAATIPPIGHAPWAAHRLAINDGIRWAVAQERAAGQRVTLVETPPNIAMSSDTVHPSEVGYATLGDMWANAVRSSQAVACVAPNRVSVKAERVQPGQMRVTVISQAGAIQRIEFGQARGLHPVTDLAISEQTARFTIVRSGGGPSHQPFTVVDPCGQWPSFVGGGPAAF